MKRRLGWLVAGSLAFWLAVSYPARLLGGDSALGYSAVAAALCLAPTLATLAWAGWALERSPEQQLLMLLGGWAAGWVRAAAEAHPAHPPAHRIQAERPDQTAPEAEHEHNPIIHVLDTGRFELFESRGVHIHLPNIAGFQVTKYMVLEVV